MRRRIASLEELYIEHYRREDERSPSNALAEWYRPNAQADAEERFRQAHPEAAASDSLEAAFYRESKRAAARAVREEVK